MRGRKQNGSRQGLERAGMGSCLMGTEFQLGMMGRVLERDGGEACTTR